MATGPTANMMAADLYCDVPLPARTRWRELLPGLAIAALGALAAGFFADRYGAPLTMMALLFGLALNFLSADGRLTAGLRVASQQLLRWGIVLVGARVTVAQVAALGLPALACIVAGVALTMAAGVLVARRLGLGADLGLLAGGAVGICGASAAMALAVTLGPRRIKGEQLTLVLVGIAAASAGAMLLYPLVAHAAHLSDLRAGYLLGASIHDVAQALGAGYSYSEAAGQVAAITKLTRVALLAPVLLLVSFLRPGGEPGRRRLSVPWFVVGFFGLAGLNSLGLVPHLAAQAAGTAATALLVVAVTATGVRSPLPALLKAGPRPLLVIAAASVVAFLVPLAAVMLVVGR